MALITILSQNGFLVEPFLLHTIKILKLAQIMIIFQMFQFSLINGSLISIRKQDSHDYFRKSLFYLGGGVGGEVEFTQ